MYRKALKSADAALLSKSQSAVGALCLTVAYDAAHTLRKVLVYAIGMDSDDSLDLISRFVPTVKEEVDVYHGDSLNLKCTCVQYKMVHRWRFFAVCADLFISS